jgi:hypothetical protein
VFNFLVRQLGEIRYYSLPTAGGTTHVICVGAQNAYLWLLILAILELYSNYHLWKVSLTEIDELTNLRTKH